MKSMNHVLIKQSVISVKKIEDKYTNNKEHLEIILIIQVNSEVLQRTYVI